MTDTQVCVQPRPSTVNVTLAHLLLSAVLQAPLLLSTGACSWYTTLRRQLSIDISCPQDAQQQTIRYDTRCYFNVRSKADMSA